MKKTITALAIITVLAIVQFTTYYTMADDKLAEQVIKNLEANSQLRSNTIIFSSAVSIIGNQQDIIKPYNLHLSKPANFRLIKNKLSPHVVLEEAEYEKQCAQTAEEALKQNDTITWMRFSDNLYLNKTKLFITALEDQIFFVTVNFNWAENKEFFYNENQYMWFLFSWIKI